MPSTPRLILLPETGPYDDRGRLIHADDAAAQLALSLACLEAAVAEAGHEVGELQRIRIRTLDVRVLDGVRDVLTERLEQLGVDPELEVVETDDCGLPGTLMTLQATLNPTKEPVMTMIDTPAHRADQLRGLCGGRVHLPGDPGYDAARLPWNVAVDQRPAAVAVPHSVDEVSEVVRAAAAAGLRVAPQSTGHAAAPLAQTGLEDVVLLRLSELTGVTVDAERRIATVVGGTLWRDVVEAAAPYGLAALHGSAPDVAVAGYVLGGGLSFYARRHGLASNSVRAVEIVTADGSLVRADAEQNSDLFWAVRGGGGNFGVAVAIEIELYPMPDPFAGMLLWDRERAPEVLRAWVEWTRDLPESATTAIRVMSFPPLPELPPFLSGRQLVVMDGAILEDPDRAAELLAPMRALAPEMDTFAPVPLPVVTEIHMDPPGPSPAVTDHAVLDGIGGDTIDALLGLVGPGTTTPLLMAELRHLGGAVGRPAEGGGAVSCLLGDYLLFCVAIAPTPELGAAGLAAANEVVATLQQWSTGTRALNFTDAAGQCETGYDAAAWSRLREVRRTADPQGLFVANHPV